jgi:YVTN family beta-propeller protein
LRAAVAAAVCVALSAAGGCGKGAVSAGPGGQKGTHPAGEMSGRIANLSGRPFGIAVSASGTVYVTQQDANSVARYTLATLAQAGAPIAVSEDPGDVIFNRAGTTAYASAFYGGKVHVIDVASGTQKSVIPFGTNAYRLALSADESRLFVTTVTGMLFSAPTSGSGASNFVALSGAVQGIALAPSGTALFATTTTGNVYRIDPATLAIQSAKKAGMGLQAVAVSPDGAELYVASEAGSLLVLDSNTLTTLAVVALSTDAFGVAVSPDGAQIYVTSPQGGQLAIIDRVGRTVTSRVSLGGKPRRVAFDAAGATAVIANEFNWVDVIK